MLRGNVPWPRPWRFNPVSPCATCATAPSARRISAPAAASCAAPHHPLHETEAHSLPVRRRLRRLRLSANGSSPTVTISDMAALLCGYQVPRLGAQMPSGAVASSKPKKPCFPGITSLIFRRIKPQSNEQNENPERRGARSKRAAILPLSCINHASVVRRLSGEFPNWLRNTFEKCDVELNPQAIAICAMGNSVCAIRFFARCRRLSTI